MIKWLSLHVAFICLTVFGPTVFASPPDDFGQLKRVHDASISPDGMLIAMIENADNKYSVRVTNLEGETQYKDLVQLEHKFRPTWVKWVNNERILVGVRFNALIHKIPAPYTYIYTQSIHEEESKILVSSMGVRRQFNADVLNFLMDDPVYVLMSVKNMKSRVPEVRRVNVATGKFIKVQISDRDIRKWYADLSGDIRIGTGIKRQDIAKANPEFTMRLREAGSDIWHDHSEFPGLSPKTRIFGFSEDPNEVLIGQYNGKNTLGLYGYDLSKKSVSRKLFHDDTFDIDGPVFSGNGKRLVGARFQSETQETVFFDDDKSGGKERTPSGADKRYRFLDQSADGQKILYEVTASNDSGFIGLYDAEIGKMTKLSAQYPGLETGSLGHVIPVSYQARDGLDIPAYITLPQGLTSKDQIKNIPFIVLPHGGPYARHSDRFDYFSQFFASKGFAVLQMNFRGSTGYGKRFEESGRKNWELMLEDVEDGTRWLASEGMSKADQTCIAGWSFGGYAALMGAVRNNGLYKCAVSIAGVTDLNDLADDELKYIGGRRAKNSITSGFNGRKDMRRMSPLANGDKIEIPVFLAHGTYDQRVHFDQFTRMKKKLKKTGVYYVAKDYPEEDHFMSIEKNRLDMFRALDEFLDTAVGKVE